MPDRDPAGDRSWGAGALNRYNHENVEERPLFLETLEDFDRMNPKDKEKVVALHAPQEVDGVEHVVGLDFLGNGSVACFDDDVKHPVVVAFDDFQKAASRFPTIAFFSVQGANLMESLSGAFGDDYGIAAKDQFKRHL